MPKHSDYERRNALERASHNLDQVEIEAFKFDNAPVDSGVDDERIASAMDDYEPHLEVGMNDWEVRQSSLDDASSETLEQVTSRSGALGESYPFNSEDAAITSRFSNAVSPVELVYLFCLAVTTAPNITTGEFKRLPRVFELLAADLTKFHMGHNSESLHVGWPRSDNLPNSFKELMAELNKRTNEWVWNPEDHLPDDPSIKSVKDEGMDFVVWKKSPDNISPGHLTFIGQAACGNDWNEKFDDANLDKIGKWFKPMTRIPPVKVFVTPFCLPPISILEASREAGIILDRVRLTLIAHQTDWSPSDYLQESMVRLIDLVTEKSIDVRS